MRPLDSGVFPQPSSGTHGCFRSPLSPSDLDLTSYHQWGPPIMHPVSSRQLSLGAPGYFCA